MQNRGEVSQIVDHRLMPMAISGREIKCMHLQIEWTDAESSADRFTWEPLTRINRDVPKMVQDYFTMAKIDLIKTLDLEAERRGNDPYTRKNIFRNNRDPRKGQRSKDGRAGGNNSKHKTPQQNHPQKSQQKMTNAERNKQKRQKAFEKSE